jgi:uncharacterized repeat protein (TIGR03803 family)
MKQPEECVMTKLNSGTRASLVCVFCVVTALAASAQKFVYENFDLADGGNPSVGPLVQGLNGYLYGTTYHGGAVSNCTFIGVGCGVVFQLTPTGELSAIYNFCSQANCTDGAEPAEGVILAEPFALIQANDGNFYGTTASGGATCLFNGTLGCGTIFRLTPDGAITTLHSFCQNLCYDGTGSYSLMQATNGALFGMTEEEGADHGCSGGCGTVYRLTAGLTPLVDANPNFGSPGETVRILGNNLANTASVTFNGASAKFSVVSGTELKATVPSGATSGVIQVSSSSGTLSSDLPFQVQ